MKRFATALLAAAGLLSSIPRATAQAPAVDSSAQSSPIGASAKTPATDSSAQSSPPIGPVSAHADSSIAPGTAVSLKLVNAIDSGRLKNGQTVPAALTAPLHTTTGTTLPPGTPIDIAVIATVPAGKLIAVGEFSLQAVRVGNVSLYTETQTYRGKPGHRDVPDAVPATGTDAGLPAGASLTFHELKPPSAATSAPQDTTNTPGSVNGIASGNPSPATNK